MNKSKSKSKSETVDEILKLLNSGNGKDYLKLIKLSRYKYLIDLLLLGDSFLDEDDGIQEQDRFLVETLMDEEIDFLNKILLLDYYDYDFLDDVAEYLHVITFYELEDFLSPEYYTNTIKSYFKKEGIEELKSRVEKNHDRGKRNFKWILTWEEKGRCGRGSLQPGFFFNKNLNITIWYLLAIEYITETAADFDVYKRMKYLRNAINFYATNSTNEEDENEEYIKSVVIAALNEALKPLESEIKEISQDYIKNESIYVKSRKTEIVETFDTSNDIKEMDFFDLQENSDDPYIKAMRILEWRGSKSLFRRLFSEPIFVNSFGLNIEENKLICKTEKYCIFAFCKALQKASLISELFKVTTLHTKFLFHGKTPSPDWLKGKGLEGNYTAVLDQYDKIIERVIREEENLQDK